MAGRGDDKIRQYRRPLNINLGVIVFSVIFIYVVICVFLYFTEKRIMPYEVTEGSLSVGKVYTGFALREETLVPSNDSGYTNYYAREGERVASGKLVCSVDESGELKDIFESRSMEDSQLSETDLANIRGEITGFESEFDHRLFSGVYDFKYDLKGTVLKLSNSNVLDSLDILSRESGAMVSMCYAPVSGIVVYSTDGYETLLPEQITAEHFNKEIYVKNQLLDNRLVGAEDALYKVVTSEHWSLVIQTDPERAQELLEEEYIQVRFLKNRCVSWAEVEVLQNPDGNTYLNLKFNNSMISFCTDRYVEIELITNEDRGLKVPNSAIAEKEFFLIPKGYITKGRNSENGVLKESYSENGEVSTEFIPTTIYQETETDYYLDNSILKVGNNLVKPDSNEKYTISRSATLIGVYNINKGYADFKEIQILYQNNEYSIIKPNTTYGLNMYDRIVLDAETVNVNELIYD